MVCARTREFVVWDLGMGIGKVVDGRDKEIVGWLRCVAWMGSVKRCSFEADTMWKIDE